MGQAKNSFLEDCDRGFSADSNKHVCLDCFDDDGLKSFIQARNTATTCSYCGNNSSPTYDFERIVGHILSSLRLEWGDPNDEGVSWVSREGGWLGNVLDTEKVLKDTGLAVVPPGLLGDIVDAIHNQAWCERDPSSLRQDQTLFFGWQSFSRFVINEARYTFLRATPSEYVEGRHDEMHPVEILDVLSRIVCDHGLVVTLEDTERLYRVRLIDNGTVLSSASDLGSPPREYATIPNRMSPAGISMFYGAFDLLTAIAETYDPKQSPAKIAACGVFCPARTLNVLDLSKELAVPSLYEEERNTTRPIIRFLLQFLADFTKPIARDDRSHIEYVPTQVVTEYFRHIFRTRAGGRLDGIIYPSAKNRGGRAVVVFAENSQCVDPHAVGGDALLILETVDQVNPGP